MKGVLFKASIVNNWIGILPYFGIAWDRTYISFAFSWIVFDLNLTVLK